jgi:YfiH family protein
MISSQILSRYRELIHGFSTAEDGDYVQYLENNQKIKEKIVLAQQVHQDKIAVVMNKDRGAIIKNVDGLLTSEPNLILGVHIADCLPILFYEKDLKIIGAIHAGWQGTLKRIAARVARRILKLGGRKENIMAVLGPHIGACCYNIDKERAKMFTQKFGREIVKKWNSHFYLDLGEINLGELLRSGILKNNIEQLPGCTSCSQGFFSFRRSQAEKSQLKKMLAFIGRL